MILNNITYDATFLDAQKFPPKTLPFQVVVTPEGRSLCINFTLNQPLTAPQISRLISSWLLAEESLSCGL
jgi:hypothetical protein